MTRFDKANSKIDVRFITQYNNLSSNGEVALVNYVLIKDAPIFNLANSNGDFEPSYMNFSFIADKLTNGICMQLEASQPTKVAVINYGLQYVCPYRLYYGLILEKTKLADEKWKLKVSEMGGGVYDYIVDDTNMKEEFFDMNTNGVVDGNEQQKEPEKFSVISYTLGGSILSSNDENETDQTIAGDGSVKILKVYDVAVPE